MLLALMAQQTWADIVSYNERSWDEKNHTVVTTQKTVEAKALSTVALSSDWLNLVDGWYYVDKNISVKTLHIYGSSVQLILKDGTTLSCSGGVKLEGNRSLTIYSQSDGDQQGKLVATNSYDNGAGIGTGQNADGPDGKPTGMGRLTIHGGDINAKSNGRGAGIGGGKNRGLLLPLTIYGGKIKAKAYDELNEYGGAGIGGGGLAGQGAEITIYGGEVDAEGGGNGGGAGIGGGGKMDGGTVKIHGGHVKACGGYIQGAGIGGGSKGTNGEITITGGRVEAVNKMRDFMNDPRPSTGAAIGAGYDRSQGGAINISGGTVIARGLYGAGIGGGEDGHGGVVNITGGIVIATATDGSGIGGGNGGNGGNMTVSGGEVAAMSTQYGSGIGGGRKGNGGKLTVKGGSVTATGGFRNYEWFRDHGAVFTATYNAQNNFYSVPLDVLYNIFQAFSKDGEYWGAGIGGGDKGNGGEVDIQGGTVIAFSGHDNTPGIGAGRKGDNHGKVKISEKMLVSTGESDKLSVYKKNNLVAEIQGNRYSYISDGNVKMSACCNLLGDLKILDGMKKNVVLSDRTFLLGGQWNSLCLPFSVDNLKESPLEGATLYTLAGCQLKDGILTVKVKPAGDKIEAGKPYLARWTKPADYDANRKKYDRVNVVFKDVTIHNISPEAVTVDGTRLRGNFTYKRITTPQEHEIVMRADGAVVPVAANEESFALMSEIWSADAYKYGNGKDCYQHVVIAIDGQEGGNTGGVSYIDHVWDEKAKTSTAITRTAPHVDEIVSPKETTGSVSVGDNHWYVVKGNVTMRTLNVDGTANIILSDGCTLTLDGGLKVGRSSTVNLYAQSEGSKMGKLTATNVYEDGAGIGGSQHDHLGNLTIHGGDITATGNKSGGAGIGGGDGGNGGNITIYGGHVKAFGGKRAAGIGGAKGGMGGDIKLLGGTVEATIGKHGAGEESMEGSAIGTGPKRSEKDPAEDNKLDIGCSNVFLKVSAGKAANAIERVFTASERVKACHWHSFAKVEPCQHTDNRALSYILVDDTKHKKSCQYCGYTAEENHDFKDGKCVCGRTGQNPTPETPKPVPTQAPETWKVTVKDAVGAENTKYDGGTEHKVIKGQKFTLPTPKTPEGYDFLGWLVDPYFVADFVIGNGERERLKPAGMEIDVTKDMTVWARYGFQFDVAKWEWAKDYSQCWLTIKVTASGQTFKPEVTITKETKTEGELSVTTYTAKAQQTINGTIYEFDDKETVVELDHLQLKDGSENMTLLDDYDAWKAKKVTLTGRTFVRDGRWQALSLPFDVATLTGTPLEDAKLMTMGSTTLLGDVLTVKLVDATKIEAGKPYLVKWTTEGANITDPEFRNVTIDRWEDYIEAEHAYFSANNDPVEFSSEDDHVLFVQKDNGLVKPSSDMLTFNAFRGFFVIKDNAIFAARFFLDDGTLPPEYYYADYDDDDDDDDETTVRTVGRESFGIGERWYTLDGRRLQGKPDQKGIYINNGKKIVIK